MIGDKYGIAKKAIVALTLILTAVAFGLNYFESNSWQVIAGISVMCWIVVSIIYYRKFPLLIDILLVASCFTGN